MKKILALFIFVVSSLTIQAQTPYDTVNVRDPQNFVEMTTIDTAYGQIISRKANLNRRIGLQTLKDWILTGVDGIDTVYWSGDTLNILQGLTLWQAVADDNSGLFDASNNNDTIRVSTALLRAAFNLTGGAYGMNISSSSVPFSTTSTGSVAGWFTSGNSGTTTYMNVLDVSRTTTGTAAAGLGGRIRYVLEADNGGTTNAGYLGVKWISAAAASPTSAFEVRLLDSGAEHTRLSLAGSGQLTLDGYANNALNNVDSSLYLLAVDATGDVHTRAASTLADGNGIISELPVGDVVIGANNHSLFIDSLSFVLHQGTGALLGYPHWNWGVFSGLLDRGPFMEIGSSQNGSALITTSPTISYGDTLFFAQMLYTYGDSIRNGVKASKYGVQITADTLDATGVTTFLGFPSGGGGASDGNGIIDSLPNGSITIDPNNYDLQIGTPAANNTGEFEFYALTDEGNDVTIYAGSSDSTSAVSPADVVMMSYKSGGKTGGFLVNNRFLGKTYNSVMFGDSILVSKYAGDTLALFISQLPITGVSEKYVMLVDSASQRVSMVAADSFGGGADTDDQTLSTSNDTLTISGGNSVKLPITELLRDSVTTTTMTIDLETRYQKIVQIDMTSATSLTLTINNPTDAGVYTFHFLGVSGTDNVTWPAAFYDANNTALGTDALTAGTMYTCYYSSADAKYFCK